MKPTERSALALAALTAALCFALLAPSSVFAGFSQPFLRQISSTPSAPKGCDVGTFCPGGVAIDAAGNLWVGNGHEALSEFGPSGAFLKTLALEENLTEGGGAIPFGLSINYLTGDFYVAGGRDRKGTPYPPRVEVFDSTGKLLEQWPEVFGSPINVVVDHSTESVKDPSACGTFPLSLSECTVYASHGDGPGSSIEKFNASGAPVEFTDKSDTYITGNAITGTPTSNFQEHQPPGGVAVDSMGDIYVADNAYTPITSAVVEYRPSGEFWRAFTGEETPGLGESREHGGFGGYLEGVAVDPVSGLVAVSVSEPNHDNGAVDEFDPSSGRFIHQITETSSGNHLRSAFGVTFDPSGDLYVVDAYSEHTKESAVDAYGPGRFIPNFRLVEATDRTSTSAVLNGMVESEGRGLGECYFEYVDEAHYAPKAADPYEAGGKAPCVPAPGAIPLDSNYHAVHAEVGGLSSGTTYRYRVAASIPAGKLGGAAGFSEPVEFTAPHAPRVGSTSAANISSMYADLRARIDPLGADTTYRFQYVDEAAFNATGYASAASTPGVDVGSGGPTGSSQESVVQHLSGLTPGTLYHFRVIAENALGATAGEVNKAGEEILHSFTTLPEVSRGLPDGRAYELLTPPNKGSAQDMFGEHESEYHFFENRDFGYAAMTGDRFLLETESPFDAYPALQSNASSPVSGHNAYVFSRSPAGWQTVPFGQPSLGVQSVGADVFNPEDLAEVGIDDQVGAELSAAGMRTVSFAASLGTLASGPSFTQIQSDAAANETKMVGASRDLGRVVVESKSHVLAPGDEEQDPGTSALYEFAGGKLTLVNVDGEGSLLNRCGALLGQTDQGAGVRHNAVSADGSKIFFTAPYPRTRNGVGCWDGAVKNAPQLYMRSGGQTIEVSAPEEVAPGEFVSDPTGQHFAIYVGASEDGRKVFFVTETELTAEAAELKLHDSELYEYDTNTGVLTRVSAGEPGSPARAPGSAGAEVFVVPAVSAEGTAIYFTAFGRLTTDAKEISGEQVNLYRYDTATGKTAYVASVAPRDYPSTGATNWWKKGVPQVALSPSANWYATPDGRYLVFASTEALTGYSTADAKPKDRDCPVLNALAITPNGHCFEVYRYDSVTGNTVCVSCDPSGAAPVSNAFFGYADHLERPAAGPLRAMSNNGSYVFFDTADPLVPQDKNGTLDVYEWEARGSGGCELANGCVHLISPGTDPAPSYFLGADADGSNVFFGTHARLVPQDTDTAGDVYDARICTAVGPCVKPPPGETAQCEGDACQSPPAAPIDATPGSLTFSGAGNLMPAPAAPAVKPKTKPARCRKGFVRKKGRCVRAKPKRKAKKSNHRRGR